MEQLVAPQWEAYCGEGFERLCREALPAIYAADDITGRYQVGEYWDRDLQVDVVGLRGDGWIDLGECKWSGRPSLAAAATELRARCARFPADGRAVRQHLFFRRAPAAAAAADLAVHDLDSLYGEAPGR